MDDINKLLFRIILKGVDCDENKLLIIIHICEILHGS